MANEDIRLSPDIIRAIEEGLSRTGETVVKSEYGSIKVTAVTAKVIIKQEI